MNFALERLRQIRARVTEAGQEPAPAALPSTAGVSFVGEARGEGADPIVDPPTGGCIEPTQLTPTQSTEAEVHWIKGEPLHRLPEELQGLVCSRGGWTPEAWRDYLKERARRCDSQHRNITLLYLRAADLIDEHATVRKNCTRGI